MNKRNFLSGREKELQDLADQYEAMQAAHQSAYWDADDLADLADWYASHKKFKQAEQVVKYGLDMHPMDNTLLTEQAYLYIDTQQIERARAVVNLIDDFYSTSTKILNANLLIHEGRKSEAEQLLESIDEKDDLNNIIDVAYTYIDMGETSKAQEWLEYGKGKYESHESYIAACADCTYNQGNLERAIDMYNRLIDIRPYCPSYWCGLAYCHYDLQMPDKVIEDCDYALVADDEYGEAYLLKGQAFYMLGNEKEGLENYHMAAKYNALSDGFLQSAIGLKELNKGNWKIAFTYLQQAIESHSTDIEDFSPLYINAALCLMHMNEIDKAYQYCREAEAINPQNIDVLLLAGQIYMGTGQTNEALHQWDRALRLAPYADTWNDIGEICMELGKLEQAREAFEQARILRPNIDGIYEKLTSVCLLLGDMENAQKYNQGCRYPLHQEEIEQIKQLFKTGAENETIIQKIRESFENYYTKN